MTLLQGGRAGGASFSKRYCWEEAYSESVAEAYIADALGCPLGLNPNFKLENHEAPQLPQIYSF